MPVQRNPCETGLRYCLGFETRAVGIRNIARPPYGPVKLNAEQIQVEGLVHPLSDLSLQPNHFSFSYTRGPSMELSLHAFD